ncbi:Glucose-1-phosphate adenylyltransferase [Nitrospira moscoviensis]|uniref:Glucose-1-phosphate adenylyltransferase n=2 Tax=Nitrospira moscoviensis TaxID=42253 RepID=A0A0K2GE21_NITMO|nr:Glucose-1-phosphate adenylyltransferase [Nitrospira moscoviensis]
MIMAGGKGERLMPLTAVRSKPAVPFGGKYRIVDFVLSNFVNSGLSAMYVLVQYKSQSLIEHLRESWRIGGRLRQHFITVVPPQMRSREGWYEGTADAVYQNLNLIEDFGPGLVAVFGADHIYRMDLTHMIDFHLETEADVTVAALPVPVEEASGFGIVEVDRSQRVVGFEEKPKRPKPMPQDPSRAFSSMGNYLFRTDLLIRLLERDASRPGSHDFGRNIIPELIGTHRVFAYDFLRNRVPGVKPHEEPGYWRDVGTLDAYWRANMDLLGERPVFDLRNAEWPILAGTYDGPMASVVRSELDEAMVGQGCRIVEAQVRRSVIGRGVHIEPGALVEDSVILDGVHIGANSRLRRVIADRFSSVPADRDIGSDTGAADGSCHVSPSGLVVIPKEAVAGERARLRQVS